MKKIVLLILLLIIPLKVSAKTFTVNNYGGNAYYDKELVGYFSFKDFGNYYSGTVRGIINNGLVAAPFGKASEFNGQRVLVTGFVSTALTWASIQYVKVGDTFCETTATSSVNVYYVCDISNFNAGSSHLSVGIDTIDGEFGLMYGNTFNVYRASDFGTTEDMLYGVITNLLNINDSIISMNANITGKIQDSTNRIVEAIKQNENGVIIENLDKIDKNQQQTNEKLDELNQNQKEMNDYLTDDTAPEVDFSGLGNVQGLLPEGPVDSLLNIPFYFLSVVNSSFGGVCVPISGNFVFNQPLTIPCFSEMIYDNVPDTMMTFIELIPTTILLIFYFKHLYKKVNRAVSMEATAEDEWGAI